jgi:hypothetical protein
MRHLFATMRAVMIDVCAPVAKHGNTHCYNATAKAANSSCDTALCVSVWLINRGEAWRTDLVWLESLLVICVFAHSLHHGQSIKAGSSPKRSSRVTITGFVEVYCIGGSDPGSAPPLLVQVSFIQKIVSRLSLPLLERLVEQFRDDISMSNGHSLRTLFSAVAFGCKGDTIICCR